jgi:iron complex transport system substrate-binding protein
MKSPFSSWSVVCAVLVLSTAIAGRPAAAQSKLPEALSLTDADREVLISDASGRPLRFEIAPRAFLALGPEASAIAHLLAAFQPGRERLLGFERAAAAADPLLESLIPGFSQKTFPGPGWTVAEAAALKPGVVLARGRRLEGSLEALSRAGVPVVLLGLDSPEQYERDLGVVGALLADKERADALIRFFRSRHGSIAVAMSGLADREKPRVLLLRATLDHGTILLQLPPLNSMAMALVRAAGAFNWEEAADRQGAFRAVTVAELSAWNPDVIVLSSPPGADPSAVAAAFRSAPRAADLKAVKAGRLTALPVDLDSWDGADPRWLLGLGWLAARVHPGLFAAVDPDAELDAFFESLYGLDKAAVAALIRPALRQPAK